VEQGPFSANKYKIMHETWGHGVTRLRLSPAAPLFTDNGPFFLVAICYFVVKDFLFFSLLFFSFLELWSVHWLLFRIRKYDVIDIKMEVRFQSVLKSLFFFDDVVWTSSYSASKIGVDKFLECTC
jgi:hypothetical protein